MALALLKLHEPLLLAQDNEGELLRATRRLAAEAFDRDALMKVGGVPGSPGHRLVTQRPGTTISARPELLRHHACIHGCSIVPSRACLLLSRCT